MSLSRLPSFVLMACLDYLCLEAARSNSRSIRHHFRTFQMTTSTSKCAG